MLLPSSADRRPRCDLQLGGLEPAVGVRSGLGRAIMASYTFCFTKSKRKCRVKASPLKVLEITAMGERRSWCATHATGTLPYQRHV
jgi:hypothetical protein